MSERGEGVHRNFPTPACGACLSQKRGIENITTGGLEGWRAGGLEGWRAGGLEGWRAGGLEGWRAGALQKGHSICNYVWVAIQTLNIIIFLNSRV